ncbi:hypothetical protein TNCV_1528111 [Trichonephila clavipes]|nr:hypothetical protein TNCV_1528111 [Trichonephila clavipes]
MPGNNDLNLWADAIHRITQKIHKEMFCCTKFVEYDRAEVTVNCIFLNTHGVMLKKKVVSGVVLLRRSYHRWSRDARSPPKEANPADKPAPEK